MPRLELVETCFFEIIHSMYVRVTSAKKNIDISYLGTLYLDYTHRHKSLSRC